MLLEQRRLLWPCGLLWLVSVDPLRNRNLMVSMVTGRVKPQGHKIGGRDPPYLDNHLARYRVYATGVKKEPR